LVHIHTCSWSSFWRSAVDLFVARVLFCRVVRHIHGAQFHRFLYSLSAPHAWLARRVFALSNRIIVLGDGWKQVLDGWADPAKVVVVPNGEPVQTPIHDPHRDRDPAPLKPADAHFRIICLANYEARKGQADLLRAAARLHGGRPVKVLLFGFESQPGQRQALVDLAAELGIAERVEVPGPVTGAEKERSLRGAQCFCLPSYDEGLPVSMLEAMALALPVVVAAVGAIPEAVVDGEQGLLYPPGDVDALTAHLQTLMNDPAVAARIGWAGRERLISSYSLERSVSLLAGVYRALVL
jgi:glycosyltransferase involved in cell wall biosynthesis